MQGHLSKLKKLKLYPILEEQTTRSNIYDAIKLRSELLDSGEIFSSPSLMSDSEYNRFRCRELWLDANDILMATRKYEMISNNGCQKYKKL